MKRSIPVPALTAAYMNTKPAAISPDGTNLAYVDSQGEVTLWDVRSGALRKTLSPPVGTPMAVTFSHDGRYVAAGGNVVRMWAVATGKLVRTFPGSGDVAFSQDGRLLATAGVPGMDIDPHAYLFEVATGRRIRAFGDRSGTDSPVAVSPGGKLAATGGEDPYWKPGPLPKDEEGHTYAPSEAFYAHDLKIKIWDTRTGKRVRMFPGHSNADGTRVLQFTSDGRYLFLSGNFFAALWDMRSGHKQQQFSTRGAGAVSSDGRIVAVADPKLVVLDVRTGRKILAVK